MMYYGSHESSETSSPGYYGSGMHDYSSTTPRVCKLRQIRLAHWQQLERILDSHDLWMKVASHPYVNLSNTDVAIIQRRRDISPTGAVLSSMAQLGLDTFHLYTVLKDCNLRYPMEVLWEYVPEEYHHWGISTTNAATQAMEHTGANASFDDTHEPPPLPSGTPSSLSSFPYSSNNSMNGSNQIDFIRLKPDQGSNSHFSGLLSQQGDPYVDYENVIESLAAHNFPYQQIRQATKDFSDRYKIGEGHFGPIYRVEILNQTLAAKRFNTNLSKDAFLAELQLAKDITGHPNLVAVRGRCSDGPSNCKLIIYEYMDGGSLRSNLDSHHRLPMDIRLKILRDAISGLQWLHHMKPQVLHHSLSSTKILLTGSHTAKIGGLHSIKNMPVKSSAPSEELSRHSYFHKSTRMSDIEVEKNRGYLAPEANTRSSEKVDIYAFGVIMFETLTGLRAYDESRKQELRPLADFLENETETLKKDLWALRDHKIQWVESCYRSLYSLAFKCASDKSKLRPKAESIFTSLTDILNESSSAIANLNADECDDSVDEAAPQQQQHQQQQYDENYVNTENPNYCNMPGQPQSLPNQATPCIAPTLLPPGYDRQRSHPAMHIYHHPAQFYIPAQAEYHHARPQLHLSVSHHSQPGYESLRTPVEHECSESQISASDSNLSLSSALGHMPSTSSNDCQILQSPSSRELNADSSQGSDVCPSSMTSPQTMPQVNDRRTDHPQWDTMRTCGQVYENWRNPQLAVTAGNVPQPKLEHAGYQRQAVTAHQVHPGASNVGSRQEESNTESTDDDYVNVGQLTSDDDERPDGDEVDDAEESDDTEQMKTDEDEDDDENPSSLLRAELDNLHI